MQSNHYHRGYFDYRRDWFGPVVIDVNNVVNELTIIVSRNYKIDSKYLSNIDRFFRIYDKSNCERVYKTVLSKLTLLITN